MRIKIDAISKELPKEEVREIIARAAWNALLVEERAEFEFEGYRIKKDRWFKYHVTFFAKDAMKEEEIDA